MSGQPDKRPCGMDAEDLTAFVWNGLRDDGGDERRAHDDIKRHLASCPDCASEVEALKGVREAARTVTSGLVPPTARFREKVMARVRDAAGRRTPANGVSGVTRQTGVAGPASRRLAEIAERERFLVAWFRPRWKLLCLATAAAACLGFVFLSRYVIVRTGGPTEGVAGVEDAHVLHDHNDDHNRAIAVRFKERRECAERRDCTEAVLDGSSLDVAGMFRGDGGDGVDGVIEGEELVLTGVIDLSQAERCLVAFRAADWEDFRLRGRRQLTSARGRGGHGPERERFRAAAATKQVVPVRGGRIDVPQVLLAKYVTGAAGAAASPGIPHGRGVVILRLRGRTEIWGREQFKRYMRAGVPHQIGVELDNLGLAPPPAKRKPGGPAPRRTTAPPERHDRPA